MNLRSLKSQCLELSIPYETQCAARGLSKGKWKNSDSEDEEMSVEWLILQRFKKEGWFGINDEGIAITLIQIMFHNEFEMSTGQPFYGYLINEHDYYLKPLEHLENVCRYINKFNDIEFEDLIHRRFSKAVLSSRRPNAFVEADCITLWNLLGKKFFVELFELELRIRFKQPQYIDFKTSTMHGRPDLTIWKSNQVKFIEVKAQGDKLYQSQINWFSTFRIKLKLDALLIHVLVRPDCVVS